ncbi:hypothetical protein BDR04DRAFT_1151315 [Suillus decipiens]|nr:hypothetical protein BDR04DRAFT_1151315 [Suillus decipiens]
MKEEYKTDKDPSGIRIPLQLNSAFPDLIHTKAPPCYDADGVSPVFIGSAIFQQSVEHKGQYNLLQFDPETMEWIRTSLGRIPHNRDPVTGGYEENGRNLYHAMGRVDNAWIPGKTGEHLGGCHVAFDGEERVIENDYKIL